MKVFRAVLFLAGLLAALPVSAQTTMDELETVRAQGAADRKEIVSNLMDFTDTESAAFWPIYNEYRDGVRKLDDQTVSMIQSFGSADSLTAKLADQSLNEWMTLKANKASLRKSYVKKFSKVLPPGKLVRYYQIENKMDAVVEYGLATNIPLVGK